MDDQNTESAVVELHKSSRSYISLFSLLSPCSLSRDAGKRVAKDMDERMLFIETVGFESETSQISA